MTEAYVFDAIRTPRGKGKKDGSLHEVKPISLLVGLLTELQARIYHEDVQPALADEDTWALQQVFLAAERTVGPRYLSLHDGGARCALPSVCPLCAEGRQVTEWNR